ncbi:MAG: hypothetical protein MUO26_14765 [Methanotrichaceae archaeon]|nr:hypothetical protein [Methanotrichaceae archaeon]
MKSNSLIRTLAIIGLMSLVVQTVHAKEEPAELKSAAVKIQEILQNESAYDGKYVVIEGKIDTECPSGCWFILNDGSATIYVDILPNNFVIPQKRGSSAKVYGEVTTIEGDPMMIGKMVEIDGAIYQ